MPEPRPASEHTDAPSKRKLSWGNVVFALLIFIVLVMVFLQFADLQKTLTLIREAKWRWLFVGVLGQALTYVSFAFLLRNLTDMFSHRVPLKKLFDVSVVVTFMNEILPSAGFSGTSFLVYFFNREKLAKGKSVVLSAIYYILINITFYFFLFGAIIFLLFKHELTAKEIIASGLSTAVILFLTIVFLLFLNKNSFVFRWGMRLFHFLNRVIKRWRKKPLIEDDKIEFFLDEFYRGYAMIREKRWKLLPATFHSTMIHVFDLVTVYAVFLAFGYHVKLSVLIIGFVLANIFSFVSFIPSGIGVFEVSMALVYSSLNIPFEAAAISVLVFRGLSFWLPIPLGLYYYYKLMNGKSEGVKLQKQNDV